MALIMGDYELSSEDLKDWTLESLKVLKQPQLAGLYSSLPCPAAQDLQGEFKGDLLDQGRFRLLKNLLAYLALKTPLPKKKQLGESMTMSPVAAGSRYPLRETYSRTEYMYAVQTGLEGSFSQQKEELGLNRDVYYTEAGPAALMDKIRKVNSDLYLGMGTWGIIKRRRRNPFFFALSSKRKPFADTDRQYSGEPAGARLMVTGR